MKDNDASMEARLGTLRKSPLTAELSPAEMQALAEIVTSVSLAKGKILFREGDAGDALYLIESGTLDILKKDSSGAEQAIAVLEPGGVVGEMSLLCKESRGATARAREDVQLVKIPWEQFSRLLESNSLVAYKVTHVIAKVLAHRLRAINKKMVEVQQADKAPIARLEEFAEFKKKLMSEWSF